MGPSDLALLFAVLIGFTLPLTLFPSITTSLSAFVSSILWAIWDFSRLFVLFVALLVGVLFSEHLYRLYLKRTGAPEPAEFTSASAHGLERETAEERRTKEFEAFARQSGLHTVVKGIFRALTGGKKAGVPPVEAVTGHSTRTARGATPPPAQTKGRGKGEEEEIELRPMTPRREGLRQRAPRNESPTKR